MKKEINYWLLILSFIIGIIICYFLCQYHFLKINPEVNVIESLISICTAIIGLYIAISLQSKFTKNQNKYSFIQNKIDVSWQAFNKISQQINISNNLLVSNILVLIKELSLSTNNLLEVFKAFNLNEICIQEIDVKIDELESLIESCTVENNVSNLSNHKEIVSELILCISKKYADLIKQIH